MEETGKGVTKRSRVFAALRAEILEGHYARERFPSERALMARFGISRGLVREVLRELRFGGFLVARPRSGYSVPDGARNMGGCIGLVVPGAFREEIFSPICQEIARLAQAQGFMLLFNDIAGTDKRDRVRHAKALVADCLGRNVSGVIFQPIEFMGDSPKINRGILRMFQNADVPVVLLDYDIVPAPERSEFDLVCIDNFNAGRAVAKHLVEQGAKRIVFLMRDNWAFSVQDRFNGCRFAAVEAPGVKVSSSFVEADDDRGVRGLVSGRQRADAIVCGNDILAARLLRTLRRVGVRVPEDVMVAGFDDVRHAALVTPPLTTVRQPCAAMAQSLFELLRIRMRNPKSPALTVVHRAPLIVRASTRRGAAT